MDIPINQKFILNFNYWIFISVFILIIKELFLINRPRAALILNKIAFIIIIVCIGYVIFNTKSLSGRAFNEPSDFNKMPIRFRKP